MDEKNVGEQPLNEGSSFGKFASAETLKQAYDNLEKEFTRKSQLLSDFQKQAEQKKDVILKSELKPNDKMEPQKKEPLNLSDNSFQSNANFLQNDENKKINDFKMPSDKESDSELPVQESFLKNKKTEETKAGDIPYWEKENWNQQVKDFLEENPLAKQYAKEISKMVMEDKTLLGSGRPLYGAWAKWLQNNYKTPEQLLNDEQFLMQVQKNEKVKRGVIKNYLADFNNRQNTPPLFADSDGGAVSGKKQSPQSLEEARELVKKIFSK